VPAGLGLLGVYAYGTARYRRNARTTYAFPDLPAPGGCANGLLSAVKVGNQWFIAPEAARRGPLGSPAVEAGVTVAQAATMLNLPVMTLRRAVAEGEVLSAPARHGRRVQLVDVEAWMESKRAKQ